MSGIVAGITGRARNRRFRYEPFVEHFGDECDAKTP